ncbi:MAG: protein-L-isoaspartate(D-aspartate) O-methyltransferase [Anaerolineales bacterium]|jgi:protein-L-isoaspartate(D-aspartate) O-methyltransferase
MKAGWRISGLLGFLLLAAACAGAKTSTPQSRTPVQGATGLATQQISQEETERYAALREQMVAMTIEARGVEDADVLGAMRTVPRHRFVPERFEDQAYGDHPLPIGYGQTISQPYMVAWMTELLDLQPGERVLEIGTGSGYQAAVLAELEDIQVYSIEIVPELAESAQARLQQLGYDQVQVIQGDGYYGWKEHAPYDAIIVTAAPDHLPSPLVDQLAAGGRLVIPIGPPGGYQTLWQFTYEQGELQAHNIGGVSFVPFTGEGIQQ